MKSIIGNNNKRRKPVNLTEKILADAQSYKPQKDLETKTNESPIIQPSKELSFVTDPKMYKEIVEFISKTFPRKAEVFYDRINGGNNSMVGSNPYIAIAVDMYLKSINHESRIATQSDLEQDLDFVNGAYVDTGLALRHLGDGDDKNQQEALNIYVEMGLMQKNFSEKLPLWVNLKGLELNENLEFKRTKESFYKIAECLNWDDNTFFSKTEDFGFPDNNYGSSRRILTSNNPLSRIFLDGSGNIDSSSESLLNSNDTGKIVLAKENKNE